MILHMAKKKNILNSVTKEEMKSLRKNTVLLYLYKSIKIIKMYAKHISQEVNVLLQFLLHSQN